MEGGGGRRGEGEGLGVLLGGINYIILMKGASVEDYSLLSVIGRGTYAKVLLVRSKQDKQVYAMKVLKKKYILEKNQEKNIMNEKAILASLSHPFLVRLKECFQDDRKLYFVLEYCPGGELFGLLSLKDRLSEEQYPTSHSDASSTQRRSSWPSTPCISVASSTASTSS